ncbi:MAG: DUF423 domain-containing protein [Acidobacteriota bacterium]
MERLFFGLGAVFGFLSVAAGAFGAHGLRGRLSPEMLEVYEVAVRYQMYHALALLIVGLLAARAAGLANTAAGWLFVLGILIFSGSLYLLSLTGARWWGAVTPMGGLCLLAGWVCFLWTAWGTFTSR